MIPPRGCPVRLNFDYPCFSRRVVTEAGPSPLFGLRYQTPLHRIAVHISQLLDALTFRKNIEIVIAGLPERILAPLHGYGKFQRL